MNEPVIDIRDRIEKMRSQMTPQSSQNQEKSFQKSSKTQDHEIDKIDSEERNLSESSSKDKNVHKRSISDDVTTKKKEFNKNFEDTETITKINIEQNNRTGDYFPPNTSQKSENESKTKSKTKSVKQEETTFPQFSLNVSNPISWKLMLLIMVMQLLTNIMLVVVLYLK